MADYKELLHRAIKALPENNGTSRRAVYEKARAALVTQLRAIDPPLPAREITQHRLTLEDCIRQVEQAATEALLRGLRHDDETEQPSATPAAPTSPSPASPALSENQEEDPAASLAAEVDNIEANAAVSVDDEQTDEVEEAAAETDAGAENIENSAPPLSVNAPEEPASLHVRGKPEPFSDSSNAEDDEDKFDESPAPEIKSATDIKEPMPEPAAAQPAGEEEKREEQKPPADVSASDIADLQPQDQPVIDDSTPPQSNQVDDGEPEGEKNQHSDHFADVIAQARAASSKEKPDETPAKPDDEGQDERDEVQPALSKIVEVDVEPDNNADETEEEPQATIDRAIKALDLEAEGKDGSGLIRDKEEAGETQKIDAGLTTADTELVEDEQVGGNGLTIFLTIAILLLGGAMGGAYWAWKEGYVDLEPIVAQLGLSGENTDPTAPQKVATTAQTEPEKQVPEQANVREVTPASSNASSSEGTGERLAPEPATNSEITASAFTQEAAQGLSVSQTSAESGTNTDTGERLQATEPRVVSVQPILNTEAPNTAPAQIGNRSLLIEEPAPGSSGAVPFTGETIWSRDVDERGLPVIKAAVSIPARNLSVDLLIRKNSDASLPASHVIEVNFSVTESFLGGGISVMPGIMLKDQELGQGRTLIGASARILDNSFLLALSSAEGDVAFNSAMLRERGWIDLPVVYATGRKAIITLEKGAEGKAIFDAVLAAWAEQ